MNHHATTRTRADGIRALLEPRSIAIVGASGDGTKQSGRPLANLIGHGYAGPIYPVNLRHSEVMGLRAYRSLGDIMGPVDLVIVLTPAAEVIAVVEEGIAAGAIAFAIYASGFAELNEEGERRQNALVAIAKAHNVVILGPNCNGVINAHARMCATMATVHLPVLHPGPIAFVGQSGAMAAYWLQLLSRENVGFSTWLPTGNEADLGIDDILGYLAADPSTRAICLYVEGVRNGPALRRALEIVRSSNKPVLALRSGRTPLGAEAARSHTGAMAAEDRVWSALLEQAGVFVFNSLTEMVNAAKLISSDPLPAVGKALVMSISGAATALISDATQPRGIVMPAVSAASIPAMTKALPSYGKVCNPLDLTGSAAIEPAIFKGIAQAVRDDPAFDSYVLYFGLMAQHYQPVIDAIVQWLVPTRKPVLVIWMAAQPEVVAALNAARLVHYEDVPQAMDALATWVAISNRAPTTLCDLPSTLPRSSTEGEFISEANARRALGEVPGLAWPAGRLLAREAQVQDTLSSLEFPLVAKIQSAQMPHKTELGGIILGLQDAVAVRQAVNRLFKLASELAIPLDGVLLQEMVSHEHELVVGIRQDPVFGSVLLVGKGGVEAEADSDIQLRLLPVTVEEIRDAIGKLRMVTRLSGWRGKPAIDLDRLALCIFKLTQRFASRPDLLEIEINPLAAIAPDRFVVLDALLTVATTE